MALRLSGLQMPHFPCRPDKA